MMKNIFSLLIILSILGFSCNSTPEEATSVSSKDDLALVKKSSDPISGLVNPGRVTTDKTISEKTDFGERISIKLSPFIPDYSGFSEQEKNMLSSRLNAAVAQVGYGGEGSNPRFIIGPSIIILSSELTTGAPTLHAVTYEVNFLVADFIDETIFASYTTNFKGVGQTPAKAFISGFRDVDLKTHEFYGFLQIAEEKINSYYTQNCEKFITQANAEIGERNFNAAYAILKNIPFETGECFTRAQKLREEVFNSILSEECNNLLQKMKAELGKLNDASASGYNEEALEYYMLIDRESRCFAEAETLYQKYLKGLKPKEKRDWDLKMKQLEHEMNFTMDSITAMTEFQLKMKEFDTRAEIDGSKKLLEKYESDFYYDRLPWIRRVFHLGDNDPFDGSK